MCAYTLLTAKSLLYKMQRRHIVTSAHNSAVRKSLIRKEQRRNGGYYEKGLGIRNLVKAIYSSGN